MNSLGLGLFLRGGAVTSAGTNRSGSLGGAVRASRERSQRRLAGGPGCATLRDVARGAPVPAAPRRVSPSAEPRSRSAGR